MKPGETVKAWVDAFNKADANLITNFYSDDAINHQVAEKEVKGKLIQHTDLRRRRYPDRF